MATSPGGLDQSKKVRGYVFRGLDQSEKVYGYVFRGPDQSKKSMATSSGGDR